MHAYDAGFRDGQIAYATGSERIDTRYADSDSTEVATDYADGYADGYADQQSRDSLPDLPQAPDWRAYDAGYAQGAAGFPCPALSSDDYRTGWRQGKKDADICQARAAVAAHY